MPTKQERFIAGEVFKLKCDTKDIYYRYVNSMPHLTNGRIDKFYHKQDTGDYHCNIDNITTNGATFFTHIMNKSFHGKFSFRNIEFINQ